jgi:hypothetical protein
MQLGVDTAKNLPMTEKEAAGNRYYDAASRPILKVSKDFHRSMQKIFYYFSLRPGILKI